MGRYVPTNKYNDPPTEITQYGTLIWRDDNGEYHRDDDKHAIMCHQGYNTYYNHGKYHRPNNKPAIEYLYYKPEFKAIRFWDNCISLLRPGYHKYTDEYYYDGNRHRTNGPAFECATTSLWFEHGKLIKKENKSEYVQTEFWKKYDV